MRKILAIVCLLFTSVPLFAQSPLKVGDKAPVFNLKDNKGKQLDLKKILQENKSVVLFFYRGQWCPHCNKHIKNLQDSLQLLTNKGAYVIGVSPESSAGMDKTVAKNKVSFSMISDRNYSLMKAYGVDYIMETGLADRYKNGGLDIAVANGQTDYVLPVPATYIINKSGKIKYVFFEKDYKKRPSVSSLERML